MVHSASLVPVIYGTCVPHHVGHSTELLFLPEQVMPARDKVEATRSYDPGLEVTQSFLLFPNR